MTHSMHKPIQIIYVRRCPSKPQRTSAFTNTLIFSLTYRNIRKQIEFLHSVMGPPTHLAESCLEDEVSVVGRGRVADTSELLDSNLKRTGRSNSDEALSSNG